MNENVSHCALCSCKKDDDVVVLDAVCGALVPTTHVAAAATDAIDATQLRECIHMPELPGVAGLCVLSRRQSVFWRVARQQVIGLRRVFVRLCHTPVLFFSQLCGSSAGRNGRLFYASANAVSDTSANADNNDRRQINNDRNDHNNEIA